MDTLKIKPQKNLPETESFLYRYITIDKLLDFLLNERIPLVRLNLFEDKFEGVDIEHLLLNYGSDKLAHELGRELGGTFKMLAEVGNAVLNPTSRNSYFEKRVNFQKNNYASCWYINNHESIAMWLLYSKPDSVAIKIPYKVLKNHLIDHKFELPKNSYKEIKYGSVNYFKYNDIDELTKIAIDENEIGFIKDMSFQHEQEFRIMLEIIGQEKVAPKKYPLLENNPFDPFHDYPCIYLKLTSFKELPFEIIFHPQSLAWHRNNIVKIIKTHGLSFPTKESALKDFFK